MKNLHINKTEGNESCTNETEGNESYAKEYAEYMIKHMLTHPKGKKPKDRVFYDGELKLLGCLYYEGEGVTSGMLSTRLKVSTARIARMLNTLEDKGLTIRETDAVDKRKTNVYLSDKGRSYVKTEFQGCLSFLENMFIKLGENDTREYIRILNNIENIVTNNECHK